MADDFFVCLDHLQNVAQRPVTATPAPATPVTLHKRTCNTAAHSQAGGKEKASDDDDMHAEEGTEETLMPDDDNGEGAGGDAAGGGEAQGANLRGEM